MHISRMTQWAPVTPLSAKNTEWDRAHIVLADIQVDSFVHYAVRE